MNANERVAMTIGMLTIRNAELEARVEVLTQEVNALKEELGKKDDAPAD